MRLVYFGTGEFAVPALKAVAQHVTLVITQPDRPRGRGLAMQPSEVKRAAWELGLVVESPERARSAESIDRVRAEEPDALLVASYGQILSEEMLGTARRGGINLHASLLPRYRGAAPIQRCLLDGCTITGVTVMQMDRGMDTGDVIASAEIAVGPDETYGELQERLAEIAAAQAAEWMPRVAAGAYGRSPQPQEHVSLAPKIQKGENELRLENPARLEFNRYRAFTPKPGAVLATSAGPLKVLRAQVSDDSGRLGTILQIGAFCRVAFREGSLDLISVQPAGKRPMGGRDFANGARLKIGDSLR